MPPATVYSANFAAALTVLWLLGLGAIVGSFINVVVFRTPRGQSLVWPGSRCPRCAHPIRWYDNLPVLSWLVLGGRCRDCQGPISARYPAVEALCAAMFLGLGLLELGPEGFSRLLFALNAATSGAGPEGLLPQTAPASEHVFLVGLRLACHLLLLCTLLAHLLICWDGQRTSGLFFLPATAVGLLAGSWPGVRLVQPWPALTGPLVGPAGGVAGLLAGSFCDALFRGYWPRLGLDCGPKTTCSASGVRLDAGPAKSWIPVSGLAAIGAVLGWQAASLMALAGLASELGARALASRLSWRVPAADSSWLVGSAVWTIFWVVHHNP